MKKFISQQEREENFTPKAKEEIKKYQDDIEE
jgi:hypothetical protein